MSALLCEVRDEHGSETLTGDTVEEIAAQLPEDYDGPRVTVRDEAGFVRGWIGSRSDWRAS